MLTNGVSLADIAAVTDGNRGDGDGFSGNNGWWVLIILFALFGGWGRGNGYGAGTEGGGALTRGDLCMDMNFNGLQNDVRGLAADVQAGFRTIDNAVCTLGYNSAQLANGINMQVANGFGGLETQLCQLGNNVAQQFNGTNLAILQGQNAITSAINDCCCENRAAIADVKYQMAADTCAIGNAIQSGIRDISDKLDAQYTRNLENELQAARLKASQVAQNEYLINQLRPCPTPAYITCNPWANQAAYGSCGTGCGCGNY